MSGKFFIIKLLLTFLLSIYTIHGDESKVLQGPYLGQKPPKMIPDIFAPGIISHGYHEHNLTISPDGGEIFYTTSSGDHQYYVILHIKRTNNLWGKPEIATFSGKFLDMGPRFSPDGRKIFYCSKRPLPGSVTPNKSYDLWFVQRDAGSLSEPQHLGDPINTEFNEAFPSIAANGNIYYHYWQKKGSDSDIYISKLKNGKYQTPQRLESGISTEYYEGGPYVAPDESLLLFQAIRPDSFRKNTNIYVSFRNTDGSWGEPRNLGETVNGSGYPISPMISPDGKYLFYATNSTRDPFSYSGNSYNELLKLLRGHQNGYGSLWWVDAQIIEKFRPNKFKKRDQK